MFKPLVKKTVARVPSKKKEIEEYIKSNISNFIKEKNDEINNMIFNRIIDDINKSVENYEEYFT